MPINTTPLTGAIRSGLVGLQQAESLLERTQARLAAGKNLGAAIDTPINYFPARSHLKRADDPARGIQPISQTTQGVKGGDTRIQVITGLIEQGRMLAQSARATTDAAVRMACASQLDRVLARIDSLAADSGDNWHT